uniref:Uncharacterized protein n=1 Tax=Rangifer tarandus platyrhynchus TaxID=3082113 RepID=A0ACB0E5U4_RANTA|nr:unnamed protein product [Rangifer tarandus platyrhynchus]
MPCQGPQPAGVVAAGKSRLRKGPTSRLPSVSRLGPLALTGRFLDCVPLGPFLWTACLSPFKLPNRDPQAVACEQQTLTSQLGRPRVRGQPHQALARASSQGPSSSRHLLDTRPGSLQWPRSKISEAGGKTLLRGRLARSSGISLASQLPMPPKGLAGQLPPSHMSKGQVPPVRDAAGKQEAAGEARAGPSAAIQHKTGQKNACTRPSNCDRKEGSAAGCSGGQATRGGWASPRRPPGAGPGGGARDTAGPQASLLAHWADLWMRSKARPALRAAEGLTAPSGQPRLPVEWGLKSEGGVIACCPLGARGHVTLGTGPRLQQQDLAFRCLQTAGQGPRS